MKFIQMDDSIHSFNSEKYCFLSMFPEVVYWKLVTSNKMNFMHVRKNAYFFVNSFFLKSVLCYLHREEDYKKSIGGYVSGIYLT